MSKSIFRVGLACTLGIILAAVALIGGGPAVYSESAAPTAATPVPGSASAYLPLLIVPDTSVPLGSILTPFDTNSQDQVGPLSWSANYGKSPEIIVATDGTDLHVLAQDYDSSTSWNAVLLHLQPDGASGYQVVQALTDFAQLDHVMGLAIDAQGNRYIATGVAEDDQVDATYPPTDTTRSDIVRILKIDPAGSVIFDVDLDTARHAFDSGAEMIVNPMVAGSSRLAVGGGELAIVHGNNTDPDPNIGGRRHQKALSTRLNANTGAITRVSSVWVSHSFDQRLMFDGDGIIEHHLGDAFPRYLVMGRDHSSHALFHIKGDLGENLTATRLGNLALIENDPPYKYLALFATESTATAGNIFGSMINGPRNLAIVRVNGADNTIDPNLPDSLTVTSKDQVVENKLRWLTNYTEGSDLHAERPKLIGLGNDTYVVLWEQWLADGRNTFQGVYGMVIDDEGNALQPAKLITANHHLPRGDDAFLLDGQAAWMTGNAADKRLHIHVVDDMLNYDMTTVD